MTTENKGELRFEFRVPVTLSASTYGALKDDIAVNVRADNDAASLSLSLKELLTALFEMENDFGERDDLLATIRGLRAVAEHANALAGKLQTALDRP